MPKVKVPRKKKTKPSSAGPSRPATIEALLREVDERLERLAAEGAKCAESLNDPSLPRLALLAARWIVTRRLLDLELASKGTRFSPGDTPWRVDDAWFRAVIEAETAAGSISSAPQGRADDPLAHIAEEIATYRKRLQEMAREHEDEFVLIQGSEIVGFFPDDSSAMREGYRRFGRAPFLVKEVTFPERVVYIPNVVP